MSNQINPLVVTCAQHATYDWTCKQVRFTTEQLQEMFKSYLLSYTNLSESTLQLIINSLSNYHITSFAEHNKTVYQFSLHYDLF